MCCTSLLPRQSSTGPNIQRTCALFWDWQKKQRSASNERCAKRARNLNWIEEIPSYTFAHKTKSAKTQSSWYRLKKETKISRTHEQKKISCHSLTLPTILRTRLMNQQSKLLYIAWGTLKCHNIRNTSMSQEHKQLRIKNKEWGIQTLIRGMNLEPVCVCLCVHGKQKQRTIASPRIALVT